VNKLKYRRHGDSESIFVIGSMRCGNPNRIGSLAMLAKGDDGWSLDSVIWRIEADQLREISDKLDELNYPT